MISVTTPILENGIIVEYKGIVTGEVVAGVNFIKDFGASIRNIVGGRSAGYEEELSNAREKAIKEMETRAERMGANAVVGVDIDYETFGSAGMLMVSASGTAVVVKNK
ncbi:MAG: YbjQ family protein [Clostridiales bacterium]|nr:YbjQ family protein [Clostridiales bacterium]MCD7872599.1 YbjQ family protein [Clostridiales bacterium]